MVFFKVRYSMTKFYWQFLRKLIILIKPCALGQFLAKIKASVDDEDSNFSPHVFHFQTNTCKLSEQLMK